MYYKLTKPKLEISLAQLSPVFRLFFVREVLSVVVDQIYRRGRLELLKKMRGIFIFHS